MQKDGYKNMKYSPWYYQTLKILRYHIVIASFVFRMTPTSQRINLFAYGKFLLVHKTTPNPNGERVRHQSE